jgi:branched-subunit amino acid transport protein
MNVWLVMVLAGLLTYAIRLSFILLFGRMEIPDWLQRALRFVPPAVLSAIIFPELLMPSGRLEISAGNPRLLAGLIAVLVAWRTRSVIPTIVVGMLALYLFQALF